MATYVLCHGGWSGGWQWRDMATRLRAAGHDVYTPTFTGLGERVHLASREVDLHTYIQDILMVLKYENLHDVVLLGYSISGAVISGVAEAATDRIGQLVYLDAYVLRDGESIADQIGADITGALQHTADLVGDGWWLPHDPPDADRRTNQSLVPVLTPLALKNPAVEALPRTFIYCTRGAQDIGPLHLPIAQAAERAKADPHWRYRELDSGHMPMWEMPQELADLLVELA